MKYIYGLIDPHGRCIRYVGQTNDIDRRHTEHNIRKENTPKGAWVRSLHAAGLYPDIVCLEIVPDGVDVDLKEKWWITLIEDHFFELTNSKNPSKKDVSFSDMFSARLHQEYDVFMAALKNQEPLVMITRAQFGVFLLLSKLVLSVAIGAVIGYSAWHFDYSIRQEIASAVWLGLTMGIATALMLCAAVTRKFRRVWFVYVYCGFYFLFALYSLFGGGS